MNQEVLEENLYLLLDALHLLQPVREAVSYRGLFTAGWFGVREKHCSRLEIYDRLRASEQTVDSWTIPIDRQYKFSHEVELHCLVEKM